MVGDNLEWDVATPRRLGMKGIWITKATTVLDAAGVGADAILPDLPALARLVSAIAPPLTSRLESWS
jgi:FMN phosphatase YigB (HAD superfamily)